MKKSMGLGKLTPLMRLGKNVTIDLINYAIGGMIIWQIIVKCGKV